MAKYKYILTVIITLCTITTFAQPAQYTPMTAAGYQMKRLKVDSTLHLPSFCGVPTILGSTAKEGALAIDTCGGFLYMWTRTAGWDTVNTSGGGGGNQDLQSVLNIGNTSINKDISLYGKTIANEVYISGMDNNFMPFMALGDSIGGGVYQYTYPQATIEFINKYMSQKLKGQDSTRSIIYLPVQTIDATDTLAKLSDVRAVSGGGGDFWKTSGTTILSGADTISSTTGILVFQGGEEDMAKFSVSANDIILSPISGSLTFPNLSSTINDTSFYKPLVRGTDASIRQATSWYGGGGSTIDTTNQFVKRLDRTPGKDSIIYFVGGNRFAIKDSVGTNPAPVGYYGAFQDTTTQTALVINTAYGVKLGVTDLTNGVTIANNSKIKIANAGIYNIQFSLQLEKTGGSGNMIADIWLRKNGVNLQGTTGKVVLTGSANASPVVAAWNYVIAVSSNDSLELMWATSNDNVVIKATPATSPHPSIPSSILTVTQQSGIMAGTGISPLDTANMLSNYARINLVNTKLNISDTATMLSSYSTRINGKLNISDTSALQRKSISAYSIMANKTSASANVTAQSFRDTSGVYDGTITWTGTTAPSGATNHTYRLTQVGKCVTINISLLYATNGTAISKLIATLPSNAPTPVQPTGLTSALQNIYVANGQYITSTNTTANTILRTTLRNNTSNNGFEFLIEGVSNTVAQVNIICQYWTN